MNILVDCILSFAIKIVMFSQTMFEFSSDHTPNKVESCPLHIPYCVLTVSVIIIFVYVHGTIVCHHVCQQLATRITHCASQLQLALVRTLKVELFDHNMRYP